MRSYISSLKIHKQNVFDQEELLNITWKSVLLGFWACLSQWWWLEVCLTNSLWDKVCILLNNGILQKKPPHFWLLPPNHPLNPSFCPPQMKFDPYSKKILDLPLRKSTISEEMWNILWLISSGVVFGVMLQNIPKVVLWWAVSKIMHTYSS